MLFYYLNKIVRKTRAYFLSIKLFFRKIYFLSSNSYFPRRKTILESVLFVSAISWPSLAWNITPKMGCLYFANTELRFVAIYNRRIGNNSLRLNKANITIPKEWYPEVSSLRTLNIVFMKHSSHEIQNWRIIGLKLEISVMKFN